MFRRKSGVVLLVLAMLGTAGAPVLKRLVSTLVVLAVVVVLVVWVLG